MDPYMDKYFLGIRENIDPSTKYFIMRVQSIFASGKMQ
jgi:hypothetical protein